MGLWRNGDGGTDGETRLLVWQALWLACCGMQGPSVGMTVDRSPLVRRFGKPCPCIVCLVALCSIWAVVMVHLSALDFHKCIASR